MSPVLVTREKLEDQALAHYRVGGEKKGVRKYQYEDGSLTPLGRIHYGVGKARDAAKDEIKDHAKIVTSKNHTEKAGAKAELYEHRAERAKEKAVSEQKDNNESDEQVNKAAKFDELAKKYRNKEQKLIEAEEKSNRTNKEIRKDVESKIEELNKTTKEKAEERIQKTKDRNEKLKEEIKEIRSLTDDELDKRLSRLQKEKQLAELINERNNREQSEFQRKASKIFKDAAENLARKALNMATDELLTKYRNRANEHKQNNNNNNNSDDKSKSQDNKPKNNSSDNGGNGNRFSKAEKSRIRSMASSGKSVAEIAKALGVDENKVKGFMASAQITIS